MIEEGKQWGSTALFDQVFQEMNISLFSPRKDQYDTCCSFKAGNISKATWKKHVKKKR